MASFADLPRELQVKIILAMSIEDADKLTIKSLNLPPDETRITQDYLDALVNSEDLWGLRIANGFGQNNADDFAKFYSGNVCTPRQYYSMLSLDATVDSIVSLVDTYLLFATELEDWPTKDMDSLRKWSEYSSVMDVSAKIARSGATNLQYQNIINWLANPAIVNNRGATPLLAASHAGYIEIVKSLVAKGADINKADRYGWTPLISAIAFIRQEPNNKEIIKFIVANGADVNKADKKGKSPLAYAIESANNEIVEILKAAIAEKKGTVNPTLNFVSGSSSSSSSSSKSTDSNKPSVK